MTIRSTRTSVTFSAPFRLPGFDASLPAGTYDIDTDEEAIEGNAHTVFRRVATTLIVELTGRIEHRAIEPKDLEAALQHDRDAAAQPAAESLEPRENSIPSPPLRRRWLPRWIRAAWSGSEA